MAVMLSIILISTKMLHGCIVINAGGMIFHAIGFLTIYRVNQFNQVLLDTLNLPSLLKMVTFAGHYYHHRSCEQGTKFQTNLHSHNIMPNLISMYNVRYCSLMVLTTIKVMLWSLWINFKSKCKADSWRMWCEEWRV